MVEEIDRHGHDLVDHRVANSVAKVAQIVLARHLLMQAGELPVATSLIAVVQIATELGVIDVRIHFGSDFEHDEAGRVLTGAASGAIDGRTQGASEAEVQGSTDEPTEAAVDIAPRRQLNGMRGELIMREPPARCLGKRGGKGVSVVLIEGLSMGDKGVEIKGRELVVGKR